MSYVWSDQASKLFGLSTLLWLFSLVLAVLIVIPLVLELKVLAVVVGVLSVSSLVAGTGLLMYIIARDTFG